QPQIVQKYSVPGQNEIETLTLKLTRVEHSAAAETFPQDTDVAAGNRYHHVRVEHDRHECSDHQVDHYTWEMALDEPPPPRWCRRRGRRPIYWPHIRFHHLFSTVRSATKRPSNSSIKRSWGKSHLSLAEPAQARGAGALRGLLPRHHRLLRARRERPCHCRAAEKRDELAPFHVWMAPAW